MVHFEAADPIAEGFPKEMYSALVLPTTGSADCQVILQVLSTRAYAIGGNLPYRTPFQPLTWTDSRI